MQPFDPDDVATATTFYASIADDNAQRLFDYLIDHPDEQRTAGDLQTELGFAKHSDVARSTYALGTLAATVGRARPWAEGQTGYRMSPELAALFIRAREQAA